MLQLLFAPFPKGKNIVVLFIEALPLCFVENTNDLTFRLIVSCPYKYFVFYIAYNLIFMFEMIPQNKQQQEIYLGLNG